jgi:hypothetical protein
VSSVLSEGAGRRSALAPNSITLVAERAISSGFPGASPARAALLSSGSSPSDDFNIV